MNPTIPTLALPLNILAQDAPGLAGQPATPVAASGSTSASAGTPVGGPTPAPQQGMDGILFMMLAFLAVFILMQIWVGRKDKKKRDSMLGGLKRNDRVQTAGGVIGAIVEVKPETVVLKVDENSNTRITFAKSAIVAVLNAAEADRTDKAEAKS